MVEVAALAEFDSRIARGARHLDGREGDGEEGATVEIDVGAVDEARAANPSLTNRRM